MKISILGESENKKTISTDFIYYFFFSKKKTINSIYRQIFGKNQQNTSI